MSEPIAIVGSSCRFPGSATSPSKLWDLLKSPRDVLREFPPERLNLDSFYNEDGEHHGCTDVQNKSYLLQEDCRVFDASFFRINPKEAEGMDPQQRLLLETTYEAFEAAGWPLEKLEGSQTGVYVGVMTTDFNDIQMRDPETLPTYTATGVARSILSNRISYTFNLSGPSMTIDTACSSSMVALHLAVQSLQNADATQAVVAGSTLLLDSSMYIAESNLHMLSKDSRSRMWDKDANGYARGEGCAALLLKPLSKAIEDGDDIECVIRSTAVNSDGRTNGITVPSAEAQTKLIRQTYHMAGLDPVAGRCQYFECHGTGTKAGDPIEAQAIHDAFFPGDAPKASDPLFCGSIKTVIGHLEGCAGIASLLKVALALKHGNIPPNMHFEELSPSVAPWYNGLCVPTSLHPWPHTHGQPARASINSFGFGGTNAHVILEKYEPAASIMETPIGPFVMSAKTTSALLESLKRLKDHVQAQPSLDLNSLAWTLQQRRTAHPIRLAIPAMDRDQLLKFLSKEVAIGEKSSNASFGVRAILPDQPRRILGVFTGQGAQWPAMGQELITNCDTFRASIDKCEEILKSLPDPPAWTLVQEIAARGDASRISEASRSQPTCTAIQIALVDLLHTIGVEFDVLIGHSSGEIGAAYAAGILNARDALGIAYYRGIVADLAKSPSGHTGAMMAVGISFDAANEFCAQPAFKNRIGVAASNSPTSVTLSGDEDAIQIAKELFDKEGTFARQLRVITGYHSHHMLSCSDKYAQYLKALDINPQNPSTNCTWYSTVQGGVAITDRSFLDQLKVSYWVDNMVSPVLFSQAAEALVNAGHALGIAVEVGPHPALKGPVSQVFKTTSDTTVPYNGCLNRGKCDVESMTALIGQLWCHLGASTVDFTAWRNAFRRGSRQPRALKDLPSYPWDHDRIYWRESRLSRKYRVGGRRQHELLGRLEEDTLHEMSWRNSLRLNEIQWLRGHTFQGQAVFPAAGYVSMAVQAASEFVRSRDFLAVEIEDFHITKGLMIEEGSLGVETVFKMLSREDYRDVPDGSIFHAEFTSYACDDERSLEKTCAGRILIHLEPNKNKMVLPLGQPQSGLPSLDADRFFKAVEDLGIGYDGIFRAIDSIHRIWSRATASASWDSGKLDRQYILHPAVLDVAFQTGFATFVSIADKATGTQFLPSRVRRLVIDPANRYLAESGETSIGINAQMVHSSRNLLEFDIDVHNSYSHSTGIRVDGLVLKAAAEPQSFEDRLIFAKTVWEIDASLILPSPAARSVEQSEVEYINAVERTAFFFLRTLPLQIQNDDITKFKWYHRQLLKGIETVIDTVNHGCHPVLQKSHMQDTREMIDRFRNKYPDSVDLSLLTAVGENLASVMRGESEMLEHMLPDNMLGRLYMDGRGFGICNNYVAEFLRYISHKHPRSKILEIGAGTGGTTRTILDVIGDKYGSYVYTDISAGFFEKASEKFADHASKMEFKTLNVENPPVDQGYEEGSFDVVVAANVLHATRNLAQTLRHARSLLRPGGFLIAVEVTGEMLRETGLMGGLEGWWLGMEDGRVSAPGISVKAWDDLLSTTAFSGVESVAYDMPLVKMHNCSVFVSRAIDESYDILREPLANIYSVPEGPLVIVGGDSLPVSRSIRRIEPLLRRWTKRVTRYATLEEIDPWGLEPGTNVLCLAELDRPLFSTKLSIRALENLQELLGNSQNVLWATAGGRAKDPHSNMMVGIARALAFELPHVNMQVLDLGEDPSWNAEVLPEYLFRMILLSSPDYSNHNMLWVEEPEVVIEQGVALVPRVQIDHQGNESLNAKRRRVVKRIGPSEPLEVVHEAGASTAMLATPGFHHQPHASGNTEIDVLLSIALHPKSHVQSSNKLLLCFGLLRDSKNPVFALSGNECSTISIRPECLWLPDCAVECSPSTLASMGAALVASSILAQSPANGTILVHDPCEPIATAIMNIAASYGREVLFITMDSAPKGQNWISVHHLARPRDVCPCIPKDTSILWSFGDSPISAIHSALPVNSSMRTFHAHRLLSGPQNQIEAAYKIATKATTPDAASISVVNVSDRLTRSKTSDSTFLYTVTDWKRSADIEATVRPLTVDGVFSPDKTYLLVGMATELGQSLCHFMASGGARNVVLCGRNPAVDAGWLEDLGMAGVNIRVVKMDVTDQNQVLDTISMIQKEMPPIAGVANAALVLEDSLFLNTTVCSIERQLAPKVNGTIFLEEALFESTLDFFICFSSLGSVYGNPGQSIYHAANMFMTSFVEKRRRQGHAGCVINVGMISDTGYVAKRTREGAQIEDHLRSQFYVPLSDAEFHELFLQAVLAGAPNSSNSEISIGISPFVDVPDAPSRPKWYKNPRFSHMVVPPNSDEGPSATSTSSQLRERLEMTESTKEAMEIYEELFRQKIEAMIKVPAASIDVVSPLSDLGLDSLLAVEIRTWLMQAMGIDVPIMKILGHVSISSLCVDATNKLFEGRLPPVEGQAPQAAAVSPSQHEIEDSPSHIGSDHEIPSTSESPETTSVAKSTTSSVSDFLDLPEKSFGGYSKVGRVGFAQASLHFISKFLDDPTMFNVTAQYKLQGSLNTARFSRALERTLGRHDAYQACFLTEAGSTDLKQGILSNTNREGRFVHVKPSSSERAEANAIFEKLTTHTWDLGSAGTFRAFLLTHSPELHTLVIGCHHIIMDGMSWHIFLRDLDMAYRMVPPAPIDNVYLDFPAMQLAAIESGEWEASTQYWLRALDPIPGVLPLLPVSQRQNRTAQRAYGNHTSQRELSIEAVQRIKEASHMHRVTTMHFYLAAVQTLVARFLELDDLCIGVTDTGRGFDGRFADMIGHFPNILPMRFKVDPKDAFKDVLKATSEVALNGLLHKDIPLDLILERLGIERSPLYMPLFQIAFNFRVGDLLERTLGDCKLSLVKYQDSRMPYDLSFNVTQASGGAHLVELTSNDYLYSKEATQFILDSYVDLLENLSADQTTQIQHCKPYSDTLIKQALDLGRGAAKELPWPESMTERLSEVRLTYPGTIAIKDGQSSKTYEGLGCASDAIAVALVNAGATEGSRIGVICEPSIDTYAVMLAVLHIGAVYVPLDLTLPTARHHAMLEACEANFLLFHSATATSAAQLRECCGGQVIQVDVSGLHSSTQQPPPAVPSVESFILFTSGSTGTPKGIRLSQRGILNYAAAKSNLLGLQPGLTVLQQSSTGFDMSIAQAFNAFANAGTLVVAPSVTRGDPTRIAQLMVKEKIEFTICTPSEYLMMCTYAGDIIRGAISWKHACSGGEAVTSQLLTEMRRLEIPGLCLTDCYGPTELSCAVTFRSIPLQPGLEIHENERPSVGRAISNCSVYIFDDAGNPLPVGFTGEICVGGAGVAKGYLSPEMSKTKFVADPFATPEQISCGYSTMYRTGDKGCLHGDGTLTFLGRRDGDTLIKLRGLRIELGEVSQALLHTAKGSLAEAVVTVRGDPEFLVAHVLVAHGQHLDQDQLDALCSALPLPRYMIPAVVVAVEHLPTTPNGKVDRKALQELPLPFRSPNGGGEADSRPLTVAEGELRLIWRELLGEAGSAKALGAKSDFFMVGGSSLLLARLQNVLKERMGVEVTLQDLYYSSTLSSMAALTSKERSELAIETIDWKVETAIPNDIVDLAMRDSHTAHSPPRHTKRCVILTGATGFLGSEILQQLITDDNIHSIHCVAVPADMKTKLDSNPKVVVYAGSLLSPTLGLSVSEMTYLQDTADQIIHAGAQGHCLNNYISVRTANLYSTHFLVRLALVRHVPLHYISSGRVILQSGQTATPPISMADHPPPTDGSQGFTSTKWASEVFLEKVAQLGSGLPVTIHRTCSIIGERAPHDDAMNSVIRFSLLTHTVPAVENAHGIFDFQDAVIVAKEIAHGPVVENSQVSFRHHSSGVQVAFSALGQRLESLHGYPFTTVDMEDWLDSAMKLGIEELIVSYLRANVANGAYLEFPYLGMA